MKGFASILGGFCVFIDGNHRHVVNAVDMSIVPPNVEHLLCSAIEDWEEVDASDQQATILEVKNRHRVARSTSNVELCLSGVSANLRVELLGEVEDHLITCGSRTHLEQALLCAPLVSIDELAVLVNDSLAEGYGATAALLEYVRECQPHLQKVADRWLMLPEELFVAWQCRRQPLWRSAISLGIVARTISASTRSEIEAAWGNLAFQAESTVAQRTAISKIARTMGKTLFPDSTYHTPYVSETSYEDDHRPTNRGRRSRDQYVSVLNQVSAIAEAVANGHDAKAHNYLRDLISSQMTYSGGEEYVVKSLCNIARQCAEMYRTDFEYECLQTAISINSSDSWSLIQLADHYKRVGRFDDAIQTIHKAEVYGEAKICQSNLADVYVQMGQFDRAMTIYDQIDDAEGDPIVRGAKADILRRWGKLDEAEEEYNRIGRDHLETHRALAGKAEIAKLRGNLLVAKALYHQILDSNEVDVASYVVYQFALANVLLRMGELREAYEVIDSVVQKRPFARHAKVFRAAVSALLGDPIMAFNDLLDHGHPRAFNEWVYGYVRGLTLLMLNRFADARTALLGNIQDSLLDEDAGSMLRLAAAVCYLRGIDGKQPVSENTELDQASRALHQVSKMSDAFAESIRMALRYHVAVASQQVSEAQRLQQQIIQIADGNLTELVTAIRLGNWQRASELEIRMLLRLAA